MAETDRKRSYFHPLHGWSESPEGATLRVDSQITFAEVGRPKTLIYRRDSDGSWTVVLEHDELEGQERGLVWQTWKTKAAGQEFLAFRGLRAIDSEIAFLLSDLKPHSQDGELLSSATDAGFLFLLSDQDAREFSRRVMKEQQGSVEMAKPADGQPQKLIAALHKEVEVIGQARRLDAEALQRSREGDFSGISAFHGRTEQFRERFLQITHLYTQLQLALAPLRGAERSEEERVISEQLLREARQLRSAVQSERSARDEEAAELDYRQAVALGKARAVPDRLRRSAAVDVGLAASRAGFAVRESADGVEIALADGNILRLGPGFELHRPSS